ncbi:MAG: helix-turn-helix domain-containing protein [Acidobacteriota bacterium]|nr:helix-turn-helix domain-containing protein [Acidobacteriota bacterium]
MDTDAGQVDNRLTLDQAANLLGVSEKTVRRYIRAGKLDKQAVHREAIPGGHRYLIDREALDKLSTAQKQTHLDGNLERVTALLDKALDSLSGQLDEAVQGIRADLEPVLRALPAAQEEREAVQAALEQQTADREKITEALGDLRQLVEQQAAEIAGLREELQEARRPWWRRIIGGGGNG